MNTANFVTASAIITRVTELKKGDVYKRLDDGSSYSEEKVLYGIVTDVLYNGEDAAIQSMEFKPGYRELDVDFKVFSGGKDIKVFPAEQSELSSYLSSVVESIEHDIKSKKDELLKAEEKLVNAKEIVSGQLVKKRTTPACTNEKIAIEA